MTQYRILVQFLASGASGEKEQEAARKLRRVWTTGKHACRGRSDWTLKARTHEQRIACRDQSLVQTPNFLPIRRFFFLHEVDGDFACHLVALAIHRGQLERADPGIKIAALEAAA